MHTLGGMDPPFGRADVPVGKGNKEADEDVGAPGERRRGSLNCFGGGDLVAIALLGEEELPLHAVVLIAGIPGDE